MTMVFCFYGSVILKCGFSTIVNTIKWIFSLSKKLSGGLSCFSSNRRSSGDHKFVHLGDQETGGSRAYGRSHSTGTVEKTGVKNRKRPGTPEQQDVRGHKHNRREERGVRGPYQPEGQRTHYPQNQGNRDSKRRPPYNRGIREQRGQNHYQQEQGPRRSRNQTPRHQEGQGTQWVRIPGPRDNWNGTHAEQQSASFPQDQGTRDTIFWVVAPRTGRTAFYSDCFAIHSIYDRSS